MCPVMFSFLHSIGETRLKNLVHSFKQNGLVPRIHGNSRRLPHNALSMSSVEFVVRFLLNYADQNGILLPGPYLGTLGPISSFFPLVHPNVQFGEYIKSQPFLLIVCIL